MKHTLACARSLVIKAVSFLTRRAVQELVLRETAAPEIRHPKATPQCILGVNDL